MALTKNQELDFKKYFKDRPDTGFNPVRNKAIVKECIDETIREKKRREKNYENKIRERADAVATYLKSRAANNDIPIEKYLGPRWLAYMQGRKIVQTMKRLKDGRQVITLDEIN